MTASNPFASAAFQSPVQEVPAMTLFEEGASIASAAETLRSSATQARKSGNHAWMNSLRSSGSQLYELAVDFLKKAIFMAASKFILELCAMIIDSIMTSLKKKLGRPMDMTSPNVFYSGSNQAPGTSTGNPYPTSGSPFRSPFEGGLTSSVSPW